MSGAMPEPRFVGSTTGDGLEFLRKLIAEGKVSLYENPTIIVERTRGRMKVKTARIMALTPYPFESKTVFTTEARYLQALAS